MILEVQQLAMYYLKCSSIAWWTVETSALIRSPYSRGTTAAAAARMRTARRPCQQRQLQKRRNRQRSSCINLWRLMRSVPRGATCWLRTGAVALVPRGHARLCESYDIRMSYMDVRCRMPCLSCGYYHGNLHYFLIWHTMPKYHGDIQTNYC